MFKKFFLLFLSFLMLFSGCSSNLPDAIEQNKTTNLIKSVWITYYELSSFIDNRDEKEFKKEIAGVFKSLKDKGFNRVTVHLRAFGDAFYKSNYFPSSSYCFGIQGSEMKYDPLAVMIDVAHKNGLSFEGWINPYRISNSTDFSTLSSNNPAVRMKNSNDLIVCDKGIFYNPASKNANSLILNGVREIVEGYDIDSICFDDYFYPCDDIKIDEDIYKKYLSNGGDMSLDEWRRNNVSLLIKSVYNQIKSIKPVVTFGVSPAANMDYNYNNIYADVVKWCNEKGYLDYICPQIYFGFLNESQPFMKTTKDWLDKISCDVYIALPMYKTGKEDIFAGENGKNEFIENNNIISRQYNYLLKLDEIKGVYIFSYSSLKDDDESKNLYSAMRSSSS